MEESQESFSGLGFVLQEFDSFVQTTTLESAIWMLCSVVICVWPGLVLTGSLMSLWVHCLASRYQKPSFQPVLALDMTSPSFIIFSIWSKVKKICAFSFKFNAYKPFVWFQYCSILENREAWADGERHQLTDGAARALTVFTEVQFSVLHRHRSWAPRNSSITQHHQMSRSPDHQYKRDDNEHT